MIDIMETSSDFCITCYGCHALSIKSLVWSNWVSLNELRLMFTCISLKHIQYFQIHIIVAGGRCGLKRKNLLAKYTRYNQIFMRPLIYIFKHFLFLFTDKPYKSYFTIWQSIYPNIFRAIYNEGPQKIPPRVATYPSTYHTILLVKYPETNIYNGPFYYRYIFIFIYYDILYILRVLWYTNLHITFVCFTYN